MSTMDLKNLKVGFIGGGNMARAIGAGLIEKGVLDRKKVWVSARTDSTLEFWKNLGTMTSLDNNDIVNNCDVIFIAVKPQLFGRMAQGIRDSVNRPVNNRKLFVSVMVGMSLETIKTKLYEKPSSSFCVVRSMPNTPLLVGTGITAYCTEDCTSADHSAIVREMFSHLGLVEHVSESQMNAIGALSGSGPAYAYQIIEGLSDGAVKEGVPREMAIKFAAQVLIGAGKMVLETKKHPGQLKDEVCSPGGTTICGVHAMEEGGVRASMMNAIKAAVARSEELANATHN